MKAWVESHYPKGSLVRELRKRGIAINRKKPDFVFVYGGDGTILEAEARFPGIPKIPLRESRLCSKCVPYPPAEIGFLAGKLQRGEYRIQEEQKVEALAGGKRLVGLNEIQVRHRRPYKGLRFSLQGSGIKTPEIIGDGLVASTPFGSTGYYRSLGYQPFRKGVQIGFNNAYPRRKALPLRGACQVRILREEALVIADNNKKIVLLKPGGAVTLRRSAQKARFVVFDGRPARGRKG